jgi:maltose O-acetyltransferase
LVGTEVSQTTPFQQVRRKVQDHLALGPAQLARKSLGFAFAELRSRLTFRGAASLGLGVRVVGRSPSIHNPGGVLVIGDAVVFAAPVTPIRLELTEGAVLTIGEECFLNDGIWLGCTERLTLGRRVLIGPGVRCLDNDYHELYRRRVLPAPMPITIEDDVWLASGCIVLPGVTVGRGAVVGAAAVVVNDVPPFTLVAGNPARIIRTLDADRFEAGLG